MRRCFVPDRARLASLAVISLLAGRGGDAVADGAVAAPSVATHAEISADDVRTRIAYLASDELAGRMTLEPGAVKASQYVADEFARIGLEPAGEAGTWFQGFTVPMPRLGESNVLHL